MKERSEIVRDIEKALEIKDGSLKSEMPLSAVPEWDSMAALVFITMADSLFGKQVKADQLSKCQTVGDLVDILAG